MSYMYSCTYTLYLHIILYIHTICVLSGGIFEANAIQFGLDQLLKAPTPKLITFIHWYYWSRNAEGLIMFYCALGLLYLAQYIIPPRNSIVDSLIFFIVSSV